MSTDTTTLSPADAALAPVATINGIALHAPGDTLTNEQLRQRACTELLRQAAQDAGLLAADDSAGTDGIVSEAASDAIDVLIDQQVQTPEPTQEACQRHRHLPHRREGARAPCPVRADPGHERGATARPCGNLPARRALP